MLDLLKEILGPGPADPDSGKSGTSQHDLRVATCALLLEMAYTDGKFSEAEQETLAKIIAEDFGLSDELADQLLETARARLSDSVDLWQFTNLINENYSQEEKIAIVEQIWRVVFADGKLDHHEDYLVHKLATLLSIEHRDLIAAKLRVLSKR